jgi:hypothetical protein
MTSRLSAAARFAAKHLTVSAAVAALIAVLVFIVWFPFPYSQIASGRELFLIVIAVDVIIGPALSFIVYNPAKPRRELWRDLIAIFLVQTIALGYGLFTVSQARPVWTAFEGDRFRAVALPDIDVMALKEAPAPLQSLSWTGPRLVGVTLLSNSDPEYLKSLELAMRGNHPAFRPSRWVPFDGQRAQAIGALKSIEDLLRQRPDRAEAISRAVERSGIPIGELGWLHLASQRLDEWIVLASRKDGEPRAFVNLDAE